MTETEKLRKELERLALLSAQYGCIDVGQILKACSNAGLEFVRKDAELPKMHPATQWPESIAYLQAQRDMKDWKKTDKIEL